MRLSAENVTHGFGERVLLRNLDFESAIGESVAIVGPSGSGKSTFLAILGGLLKPDSGTVGVLGREGLAPHDSYASWVPQNARLFGGRSVLHNIALGAQAASDSWQEASRRAHAALSGVGLQHLHHAPARTLSGGEAQRVAVARALAGDRPFVLADEPTGQLDRRTTQEVADVLLRKHSPVRGVVVVTHDLELAARCDRILHLAEGRLQA